MVLVSLIIGLGMAEVLTGIARMISYRDTFKDYWIHSKFILIVFLALLQQWWEIWGVREVASWTFAGLLMMLGGPIGLFLIANLLFPDPVNGTDFRRYYYDRMKPVLWLAVVAVVLSVSFRPLVLGTTLVALDNLSSFVIAAIFVSLSFIQKAWYHGIMVIIILCGILADVVLVGFQI